MQKAQQHCGILTRETMSRRSVDIVDQWQMEPAIVEDTPPSYGEIEVQDEDPPDKRRPLLGIKLTGCRLVNMSIILVFGIWKAVLSYRGQSAAPTTLEFVAGTLLALIVYYVGQFQEERSETCPYFFEYDLTRDDTFVIILAALRYALLFMLRARVHLWVWFVVLQVFKSVAQLKAAFGIKRAFNLGNESSGPSESNIAETVTLIVAVSPLLIGILGTLQQSFCILHRLRVLRRPLAQESVVLSLVIMSLVSEFCLWTLVFSTVAGPAIYATVATGHGPLLPMVPLLCGVESAPRLLQLMKILDSLMEQLMETLRPLMKPSRPLMRGLRPPMEGMQCLGRRDRCAWYWHSL